MCHIIRAASMFSTRGDLSNFTFGFMYFTSSSSVRGLTLNSNLGLLNSAVDSGGAAGGVGTVCVGFGVLINNSSNSL